VSQRILISVDQLSRPQPGGIASYVHGLLRGLDEAMVDDVRVIGARAAIARSGHEGVAVSSLAQRCWGQFALGVPRDADIVHATSMMGPFGRARQVQSATLHDVLWRDEPSATTARGIRFHEARLQYLLAHENIRLITVSPLLPERLIEMGVNPARIYRSRMGVDNAGVTPATTADVTALLAANGVIGPFTLHVGTREPRKNTARLVEAHQRALRAHADLGPLVFVGPDGWGAAPTGDAVVLGLQSRELVLGLLRDATLVAYVPRAEGFGLPPVEALQAGTRVVASTTCPSVAGNHEVVTVDPLDIDSIADGLTQALSLSTDEAARAARRASVADLTWRNCANDHLRAWS